MINKEKLKNRTRITLMRGLRLIREERGKE